MKSSDDFWVLNDFWVEFLAVNMLKSIDFVKRNFFLKKMNLAINLTKIAENFDFDSKRSWDSEMFDSNEFNESIQAFENKFLK